jgi:hypothetical protein
VVIVHGTLVDEVAEAFATKYRRPDDQTFLPRNDPAFDVLYLLHPTRALMWRLYDYDASQRRWDSNHR